MENHYEFVREIRRKMRMDEQIKPEALMDYYWALHRLHEYQAENHEKQIPESQNGQMKRHVSSRDRHRQRAEEYKKMALDFEEQAYPGLSKMIDEV